MYFLVRVLIKITILVEIPSRPGRRELPIINTRVVQREIFLFLEILLKRSTPILQSEVTQARTCHKFLSHSFNRQLAEHSRSSSHFFWDASQLVPPCEVVPPCGVVTPCGGAIVSECRLFCSAVSLAAQCLLQRSATCSAVSLAVYYLYS